MTTTSKLTELLERSRTSESNAVAMTVRLPLEKASVVEELAEQLGATKQETLVALIDHGIEEARIRLQLDPDDPAIAKESFYLLNTNKRNNFADGTKMLRNKCASAFYSPWKHEIDKIEKGDVVFLYENGLGIIAWGKASGAVEISDYYGDEDETHSQKLEDFELLDDPLPAKVIKKTLGYPVVFLKTLTPIRNGDRIIEMISGNG